MVWEDVIECEGKNILDFTSLYICQVVPKTHDDNTAKTSILKVSRAVSPRRLSRSVRLPFG